MRGVDTSGDFDRPAWSPVTSWASVKGSGNSFAILRATYGAAIDPSFPRAWPAVKAAGLVRGAYLFWVLSQPVAKQADAYCRAVGDLGPGDFPPILDLEFSGGGRAARGVTATFALDRFTRLAELIRERFGCWPMVYTSARVWREDLDNAAYTPLIECPLWLPRYTERDSPPTPPPPWGDNNWWCWQHAGNKRGQPGFVGLSDLNRWNPAAPTGTRGEWVARRIGGSSNAAIRAWQARQGLTVDGILGPRSFARLGWLLPAQ